VLVCHCRVVTDRDILDAIAAGARDEFDVAAACDAGTACGGCVPKITALLAAHGCAPGCPVAGALARRRGAGVDPARSAR
jgi:bacterioferritin-associated ferredoxin